VTNRGRYTAPRRRSLLAGHGLVARARDVTVGPSTWRSWTSARSSWRCGRRAAWELPAGAAARSDRQVSWAIACVAVPVATLSAVATVPALRHWFVVPVSLCGLLILPDTIDWCRRRLDPLDPQGLVGLLGTYFFYISPLLYVVLDYWAKYVRGPDDWRAALGHMAILNVLGLLMYRLILVPRVRTFVTLPATDKTRLRSIAIAIAVVGALALAGLVVSMGGPASYLQTMADGRNQLKGVGFAMLWAGALPMAGLVLVLTRHRAALRRRPALLVPLLVAYLVTELIVGGLDGSRSHTVWCLIIGIGLCHLLVKPVRRSTIAVLAVFGLAFLYFYGFYKAAGTEAFEAIDRGVSLSQLSTQTGRNLQSVLLGDLGRADIQALVLYRQQEGAAPLAHGLTYVGDLTFMVPDSLGLGRIPSKVEAGTDMLHGEGAYAPTFDFKSSYVYGLAGEALLNFGPAGAVLAFVPFGVVVRGVASLHRTSVSSPESIGAAIATPSLTLAAVLTLTSDLDNLAWFFLNYTFVFLVMALGSRVAHPRRMLLPARALPATGASLRPPEPVRHLGSRVPRTGR
jgi:hypothetical protein